MLPITRFVRQRAVSQFRCCSSADYEMKIFHKPLKAPQFGIDILHDPLWNKGTAFTEWERDRLGLRGLLPPVVRTIEEQLKRTQDHIEKLDSPVEKNMYLQSLHNRNETLYYRTLVENIEEMAPLVYTPTVGDVCQQFGSQFRRSRGMYFGKEDMGQMNGIIYNWPHDDVHVIVVTDGSRILGLGDLGVNGMGIPIGKLALYCAAGGIAPHRVLPVMLDVGTNNEELLNDPSYLGHRERRLEGQAYYDLVDEFIQACFNRWPNVVIQFEDFQTEKAVPLLERYRHTYRVFNDDIQGTGAVTLSCLLSAARSGGFELKDCRILCAGAGSAGMGVCSSLMDGMMAAGLSQEEATSRFVLCSVDGAIGGASGDKGDPHWHGAAGDLGEGTKDEHHLPWANKNIADGTSLLDACKEFKPNVLLGLSTVGGLFTEELVRTMGEINENPVIMPMSNPTAKAECKPEEVYRWTDGRAVVATGSPFGPVTMPDGTVKIPSQCNNMYIFPGLGLAASVSGVRIFTDEMLYHAAQACTDTITAGEALEGRTFPDISRIREVTVAVAVAVIEVGLKQDLCPKIGKRELKEGIENFVRRKMYFPAYVPIIQKEQ